MRSADEFELVISPVRLLGALVLAVADDRRLPAEGLLRIGRVEDELDHFPVAFVRVIPVVEDVVEPVLERELARPARLSRHVRVHGRRRSLR